MWTFKSIKKVIFYTLNVIIFIIINIFLSQYKIETEINENIMKDNNEIIEEKDFNEWEEMTEKTNKQPIEEEKLWQIEIPKISLIANIKEGTTKDILNKYVGHFETTQMENGNIGLAGHNRGYEENYFQNLKLLVKGDEIKYKYNGNVRIYEVVRNRIIKDTDWQYLENTEDNMLTLITCVENQPEYRRCVQAVEKKEERYWKKLWE